MDKNLFHVHTKRCLHATAENDEDYIQRAIALGAKSVTFTDHAPFPGDPFGNRMPYAMLGEYVQSLTLLKKKYEECIQVNIGLEIEFFPSYLDYYQGLRESGDFDILMLGQHFFELHPGQYSYSLSREEMREMEFLGCGQAIVAGVQTGLFDVVAHPDRIFRKRVEWTENMDDMARQIIEASEYRGVLLEQNESSKKTIGCYWNQFWNFVKGGMAVIGLDAHSVKELRLL